MHDGAREPEVLVLLEELLQAAQAVIDSTDQGRPERDDLRDHRVDEALQRGGVAAFGDDRQRGAAREPLADAPHLHDARLAVGEQLVLSVKRDAPYPAGTRVSRVSKTIAQGRFVWILPRRTRKASITFSCPLGEPSFARVP
jgi:hypothetical protein